MQHEIVVITGASEGIGRALAVALARAGARVVVAARKREAIEEVAAACRQAGGDALAVPTDVADETACRQLVQAAVERFGGIDMLVNNAGISMSGRFDEFENTEGFERLMRVNYLGTVYCTFHALPHLRASKGLIVGVSSLQGKTGFPLSTGYAASKHAVQGFLDSLRIELAESGVDVLVVSPGPVDTDIHARKLGRDGRPMHTGKDFSAKKQMSVEQCVEQMMRAMRGRKRELVMTTGGKLAVWLKPFAPRFVDAQIDRAVKKFYDLDE
jgi:NAD(P)-dependent dehydrogenase (short-subunit alcohol dehydrogenase family)